MIPLKQNASNIIEIGPLVDATDGFTPETAVTLSGADTAIIMKHDKKSSVDISGNTFTHIAGGLYYVILSAENCDTLGRLVIFVRDDSICRPVRYDCVVLSTDAYNNMISALSLGTSFEQGKHSLTAIKNLIELTRFEQLTPARRR